MTKELVLALWDRDFSWISNIQPGIKITKYNKNTNTYREGEIFLSPNVGRDVHTFFWHIVNNYDNLADYTFFAQDFIDDHVSNYAEIINGDVKNIPNYAVQDLGGCWFFNDRVPYVLKTDQNGAPHHHGLPLPEMWKLVFDSEMPQYIYFTAAGHFCVTKEHIHQYPVERYASVLKILETHEISPWCIERFEPYIFALKP
jgi:hypothetical protein